MSMLKMNKTAPVWDNPDRRAGFAVDSAPMAEGVPFGTMILTTRGRRPIETLVPGDLVMTFDSGFQPVTQVVRGRSMQNPRAYPEKLRPLRVPAGALGNLVEIVLLPETSVLLECDAAEEVYGDPFVLVRAHHLAGLHGIERLADHDEMDVASLRFRNDQIVHADGALLLYCEGGHPPGAGILETMIAAAETGGYEFLPAELVEKLIGFMREQEVQQTRRAAVLRARERIASRLPEFIRA